MNNKNYYINLLTSLYRNKPKFQEWLDILITPYSDIGNLSETMYQYFDVDFAIGVQLDVLGYIVGVERILPYLPASTSNPILNDDDFRVLIKAEIIKNNWDGKIIDLQNLWETLFPNNSLKITDNQDMSVSISIGGSLSTIVQEMFNNGLLVPKPQCVKTNLTIGVTAFGYDNEDLDISGYDVGYWEGI